MASVTSLDSTLVSPFPGLQRKQEEAEGGAAEAARLERIKRRITAGATDPRPAPALDEGDVEEI